MTMFGDMMGNMKQQQEAIQKQLTAKEIIGESGEGAIQVTCNGLRQVLNVAIDKSKLEWEDSEQVEDLFLIATNRALEKAAAVEQELTANSLKDMLPPGMGGLSGLFG